MKGRRLVEIEPKLERRGSFFRAAGRLELYHDPPLSCPRDLDRRPLELYESKTSK